MRKALILSCRWLRLGVVCGWCVLTADLVAAEAAAAPAEEPATIAAPAEAPAEVALPAVVHGGRLLRLERHEAAVSCIDMEQAIAAGNLEAGSGDSALEVQRAPADGTCFAVAVFELDRGRSLSKVDYRLEVDGQAFDGIAMALDEAAFDPRRQVVAEAGTVRVLFAVPTGATRVTLAPALLTAVPMRAVRNLAFAPQAASPEAAPEAAPAATAVPEAAPAATAVPKADTTPADTPKPEPAAKADAPKPEPAAKAAPAAAPKTDKPAGAKADAFEF